jgi:hypothetical protein
MVPALIRLTRLTSIPAFPFHFSFGSKRIRAVVDVIAVLRIAD